MTTVPLGLIVLMAYMQFHLVQLVMINCAGGCWHSKFNISKTVTIIYLKQVTLQQHMKKYIIWRPKSFCLKDHNAFKLHSN